MRKTKTEETAAAQVAAASTETMTTIETGNSVTIAKAKKTPPKKRSDSPKEAKESKRVTGVRVNIATVTYHHWRDFVNNNLWLKDTFYGLNTEDKKIARFVKDETALVHRDKEGNEIHSKWGGYIAVAPDNVTKVVDMLNAYTEANNKLPENEQVIDMWRILDNFQTVQPTPRAKKVKEVETETPAA